MKRWFLILGTTATTTTAAYFWNFSQTPQYQGSFKLLIEPITVTEIETNFLEKKPEEPLTDETAKLEERLKNLLAGNSNNKVASPARRNLTENNQNLKQYGTDYQSLIEVLTSPQVMEPIIEEIQTKYPEINYNYLFGKTGLNRFWESQKLAVERIDETKIIKVSYRDGDTQKILVSSILSTANF